MRSEYFWAYNDLQSYKSQSPLQREIFLKQKIPFQELQRTEGVVEGEFCWLVGLQSCFPVFEYLSIPPMEIRMAGRWGERLVEHLSKSKPSAGVFISLYFLMETNCFQKIWDVIFISSCI